MYGYLGIIALLKHLPEISAFMRELENEILAK